MMKICKSYVRDQTFSVRATFKRNQLLSSGKKFVFDLNCERLCVMLSKLNEVIIVFFRKEVQ